jgi:acyl carrier protein
MKTMLTEKEAAAIESILMEQLAVKSDQITPEARIQEDLGADSLDIVEIIMKLEEAFGITIPDEIAEEVQSVEDIHATLTKLLGR